MNRNCKVCGTDLEPEPNFYEGSMYVGYGFSVAIVVTTFVAFNILFDDPNVTWMIIIAIGSAVFFGPLSIKLSRSIWATMLMKYDPNIVKKKE